MAYLFDRLFDAGIASEVKNSKKIALILLVAAAVLIPTVAFLHAVDASTSNSTTTNHDDDRHDQDQNHQEHDDDETSDDNSVTHAALEDANENATDTD